MDGPDLERRDPNEINSHLTVAFEDVFAEPDTLHSIDCIWKNSYACFNGGKNCCYKFITTICGLCIALYWGCEFAIITFNVVWCWTPGFKIFELVFNFLRKIFVMACGVCLAPCCESCGHLFSKITVNHVGKS